MDALIRAKMIPAFETEFPVMAKSRETPTPLEQPTENKHRNRKRAQKNLAKSPVFGLKRVIFPVNSLKAGKPSRVIVTKVSSTEASHEK